MTRITTLLAWCLRTVELSSYYGSTNITTTITTTTSITIWYFTTPSTKNPQQSFWENFEKISRFWLRFTIRLLLVLVIVLTWLHCEQAKCPQGTKAISLGFSWQTVHIENRLGDTVTSASWRSIVVVVWWLLLLQLLPLLLLFLLLLSLSLLWLSTCVYLSFRLILT